MSTLRMSPRGPFRIPLGWLRHLLRRTPAKPPQPRRRPHHQSWNAPDAWTR